MINKTIVFSVFIVLFSENHMYAEPAPQVTVTVQSLKLVTLEKGWKFKTGDSIEYSRKNFNDTQWRAVVPGQSWESQGYLDYDGTGWYRIKFNLINEENLELLGLNLGQIDDVDETYFNGTLIGKTGSPYPDRNPRPDKTRIYSIPSKLIDKGENVLAIRVTDTGGNGGMKAGIPRIGDYQDIVRNQNILEITALLFTTLFLFSSFFIFMLYSHNSDRKDFFYLGLLSLLMAFIILNYSELRFQIFDNFFFWNRSMILSGFYLGAVTLFYIYSHYKLEKSRGMDFYLYFCHGLALFLIGNIVLIDHALVADNEFHDFLALYIWAPSLAYPFLKILLAIFKDHQKRQINKTFMIVATSFLLATATNDILLFFFENIGSTQLLHYGFLFFLVAVLYNISWNFSILPDKITPREPNTTTVSHASPNQYSRNRLKALDLTELDKKFHTLVYEEKIFCNEDLNLEKFAELMSITPHQLSEFLNNVVHMTFFELARKQRVAHAMELLQKSPDKPILDVAFESGFNGVSTFFSAFRKETGTSPKQFKTQIDIELD